MGGQDGYVLPTKSHFVLSSLGRNEACSSCLSPLPPQLSPCDGGQLRGSRGTVSLHRAPVYNLECVTFRPFHLYFMQNGSCEGYKLEGSAGLGPQGGACGVGGSSCTPFFPRGAGLRLVWGGGSCTLPQAWGGFSPHPLCPPNLGCTF